MERAAIPVEGFRLTDQGVVTGDGGDYKIDVLGRLIVFGDAEIVVLAECKHQKRAVERDEILVLARISHTGGEAVSTEPQKVGKTTLAG